MLLRKGHSVLPRRSIGDFPSFTRWEMLIFLANSLEFGLVGHVKNTADVWRVKEQSVGDGGRVGKSEDSEGCCAS